jgi:excisionase family DNA binding protein
MSERRHTATEPWDGPRVLYRVEDAAAILSVSRCRIYELIRSGQLRTVRIGVNRRVPAKSIEEYVDQLLDAAEAAGGYGTGHDDAA